MDASAARLSRLISCVALTVLAAGPGQASAADLECSMQYDVQGWSALVKVVNGKGTVTCSDGTSRSVDIKMRSVGATAGRSRIDHGAGKFTHVNAIDDVLGTYAQTELHGGVLKSASAQVLTKGTVSLALGGAGEGIDLGLTIGELTLSAAK